MPSEEQKDRLRLWVADLRAHPELQGREALHRKDGTFCCLGRACELSCTGFWQESTAGEGIWAYTFEQPYLLPGRVVDWYGVTFSGGFYCMVRSPDADTDVPESLADLNDAGITFPQIADLIEYEYAL